MSLSKVLSRVKPYLAMILLQVGFAGMYIISLASLKHGMNHYVLVVYRNFIAAAVMAPFALWFERYIYTYNKHILSATFLNVNHVCYNLACLKLLLLQDHKTEDDISNISQDTCTGAIRVLLLTPRFYTTCQLLKTCRTSSYGTVKLNKLD